MRVLLVWVVFFGQIQAAFALDLQCSEFRKVLSRWSGQGALQVSQPGPSEKPDVVNLGKFGEGLADLSGKNFQTKVIRVKYDPMGGNIQYMDKGNLGIPETYAYFPQEADKADDLKSSVMGRTRTRRDGGKAATEITYFTCAASQAVKK